MQISFVMLLFSDQISGRGKSFQGGNCLRGALPCPPCGRKPVIHDYVLDSNQQSMILKEGQDSKPFYVSCEALQVLISKSKGKFHP